MNTPEFLALKQKLKTELEDSTLRVYMFNVSQGDHLLIKLPNGEFGIIDFFHSSSGLNQKSPPGIDFLKQVQWIFPEKEITLAFIYLSHPDNDHLKGIPHLLDWLDQQKPAIKVRHLWWFGGNNLNKFFTQLENLCSKYLAKNMNPQLKHNHIAPFKQKLQKIQKFVNHRRKDKDFRTYNLVDIGLLCNLGLDSKEEDHLVRVYKKAPLVDHIDAFKDSADDQALRIIERYLKLQCADKLDTEDLKVPKPEYDNNTLSGVIKMTYKHFKLFFGGDAPTEVFEDCFKSYEHRGFLQDNQQPDFEAHFIKAAHHGSRNSSTPKIWERLFDEEYPYPIHIGFSAGFNYGHPHEKTINHIHEARKVTNNQVRIDATNEKTPDKLPYPSESLDWIYTPLENDNGQTQYNHPDRRIYQNKIWPGRGPARAAAPTGTETLAAFIYEFDPAKETISVTKGMTQMYKDKRTRKNRRSFL